MKNQTLHPADELFTPKQVRQRLKLGSTTLAKLANQGVLVPLRLGRRCNRYRSKDIQTFLERLLSNVQNGGV